MGTKRYLDYNPLTGESVTFEFDHATDKIILTHEADVTRSLKIAEELRQDEERTKRGIKNDMWHFAHVPPIVQMKMLQEDGVDFWDRNDWPKVFKLLNTKYAAFKTTTGTHNIKHAK